MRADESLQLLDFKERIEIASDKVTKKENIFIERLACERKKEAEAEREEKTLTSPQGTRKLSFLSGIYLLNVALAQVK